MVHREHALDSLDCLFLQLTQPRKKLSTKVFIQINILCSELENKRRDKELRGLLLFNDVGINIRLSSFQLHTDQRLGV